jgi:hypothetical protein
VVRVVAHPLRREILRLCWERERAANTNGASATTMQISAPRTVSSATRITPASTVTNPSNRTTNETRWPLHHPAVTET